MKITNNKKRNLFRGKRKSMRNPVRFMELDLLRGFALFLMIFGHFLWDLDYFNLVPMNNGIYSSLQKLVAPMFFTIVGMSILVSRRKKDLSAEEEKQYNLKQIMRGLKIFNLGMALTIITIIAIPDKPVYFGVLHCIGLIILSIPFLKFRKYNAIFAGVFIALGMILGQYHIQNPSILHLAAGIHQSNLWMTTVDYFPLFPWMGLSLMGIAIADCMYDGNVRKFKMPDISKYRPAKFFSWMGKHSLEIYLLHQPVIAGTLYIFMKTF